MQVSRQYDKRKDEATDLRGVEISMDIFSPISQSIAQHIGSGKRKYTLHVVYNFREAEKVSETNSNGYLSRDIGA